MPKPDRPKPAADKPLLRSLGEFFGHIVQGVKTDPALGSSSGEPLTDRTIKRTTIQEHTAETPEGPVTLRRTVIDEVALPPRDGAGTPPVIAPSPRSNG